MSQWVTLAFIQVMASISLWHWRKCIMGHFDILEELTKVTELVSFPLGF